MQKLLLALGLSLLTVSTALAAQLETQIANLSTQTVPKNGVRIPFIQMNLKALDGPIEINSLKIKRTGLSSNEDFGRIWAETDNYHRTNSRKLNNDDLVELNFRNPLIVSPKKNERLTIYANLAFQGGGRTSKLSVVDIQHNGTQAPEQAKVKKPKATVQQVPVFTKNKSRYDRTKYIISCKNQRCRLMPRN